MRRAWLPVSLVVLVGTAVPLACGQKFELTGSAGTGGSSTVASGSGGDPTSSGSGAMTTTTATTMMTTTTGTGSGGCTKAEDCTGQTTVCGEPACFNGHCGLKVLHTGNTNSQVYGDCHDAVCDNAKPDTAVNDTDVYDDANDCTEDLCTGGVPSNLPRAAGDPCSMGGGKVCDGKGACVACTSNSDCSSDLTVCHDNRCVPLSCFNGVLNVGETDVDCGGVTCKPCANNSLCLAETDCESGVCEKPGGQNMFRCTTPSCTDTVKNGKETAKDCGGPDCTNKCAANDACSVPGDCKSGVCVSGKCVTPSCSDGVKNGNEQGIDCGANCDSCPGN